MLACLAQAKIRVSSLGSVYSTNSASGPDKSMLGPGAIFDAFVFSLYSGGQSTDPRE